MTSKKKLILLSTFDYCISKDLDTITKMKLRVQIILIYNSLSKDIAIFKLTNKEIKKLIYRMLGFQIQSESITVRTILKGNFEEANLRELCVFLKDEDKEFLNSPVLNQNKSNTNQKLIHAK